MMLSNSQKLLLAFVTLIIGVVLIGVVASNALGSTAKTIVKNESHSLTDCYGSTTQNPALQINDTESGGGSACNVSATNSPTGWKSYDCVLTSVAIKNGTGTDLTLNTDYILYTSTGLVHFLNTTATNASAANSTYFDYTFCGDDYLNSSWGRTVLNLIGGFLAIAMVAVALGLFYDVAKDSGIINR